MGAAYFRGVLRGLCASVGTPRRVDSAKPVAARLKPAGPCGRLRGRAVPGPTGHRLRSVDGAFFGVLESREAYMKFERFKPCFNETTLSKQNVTAQLSETREGRRRCDSLAREKNCCRDSLSRQTFDHGMVAVVTTTARHYTPHSGTALRPLGQQGSDPGLTPTENSVFQSLLLYGGLWARGVHGGSKA